jgi:hypothetical protein
VSELNRAGFQVTVLTRSKNNPKDVPAGVRVAEVDYTSVAGLTGALKGHDVLVATLAQDALSIQYKLLEAGIAAGVKRFIPSEYSGNTLDPTFSQLPPVTLLNEIRRTYTNAGAEGKIEYTIIAPGGFLNLMLNPPVMLDWENHTAYLYDGGKSKASISRLSTVAVAIRAVLEKGDAYKNKVVRVHDGLISQLQLLDIAKQEQPDVKWTEVQLDSSTVIDDGLKKLAEGNATPEVIGAMLIASTLSEKVHFGWTNEELENEALGITGLTEKEIEGLIRRRARGEAVDMPNEHKGAWKINVK